MMEGGGEKIGLCASCDFYRGDRVLTTGREERQPGGNFTCAKSLLFSQCNRTSHRTFSEFKPRPMFTTDEVLHYLELKIPHVHILIFLQVITEDILQPSLDFNSFVRVEKLKPARLPLLFISFKNCVSIGLLEQVPTESINLCLNIYFKKLKQSYNRNININVVAVTRP